MNIEFEVGDKVRMMKRGECNDVYKEIGRGVISRVANSKWVYYIDSESKSPVEELVPALSVMTKLVKM